MGVDAAGISVKVNVHYPGRPVNLFDQRVRLPALRGAGMDWQESAEGIVGQFDRTEGPNMCRWQGELNFR
jgi:hypothetical protein